MMTIGIPSTGGVWPKNLLHRASNRGPVDDGGVPLSRVRL
jgi:hypothetical protein